MLSWLTYHQRRQVTTGDRVRRVGAIRVGTITYDHGDAANVQFDYDPREEASAARDRIEYEYKDKLLKASPEDERANADRMSALGIPTVSPQSEEGTS